MKYRNDQDIKKDVVDAMYWDDRVNAADVKVDVLNGKVHLTGSLPTFNARFAAVNDTWMVNGVKGVKNLVTVSPNYQVPSDEDIRKRIEEMLVWNPDINSNKINVSVLNGTVILSGSVSAYWKKARAENLAMDVNGVIDIKNDLTIVPTESVKDTDIAREIETALFRNAYVDADNVTVKVEKGKVRLTGEQSSWHARDRAKEVASYTSGVTEVENDILVS